MWLFVLGGARLSCRDGDGRTVDYYVMYKTPTMTAGPAYPGNVRQGVAFAYGDERTPFQMTSSSVNSTVGNPLWETIKFIYSDADVGFVFINDQAPDDSGGTNYAHQKGVIMFDADNGLFLSHSVPHFPDFVENGWGWPDSGKTNGQDFLCLTMDHANLNLVIQNLRINRPWIYDHRVDDPPYLPSLPGLLTMAQGPGNTNVSMLRTIGGEIFVQFAKSRASGVELYADLVMPYYQQGLWVQTWTQGPSDNVIPTICSTPWPIYTVESLDLFGVTWRQTKDHSKWAVGSDMVCFGDINRVTSQLTRGGGTICQTNRDLALRMQQVAVALQPCPTPSTAP